MGNALLVLNWPVLLPLIFVGIGQLITTAFTAYGTYQNGKKADQNGIKADQIHVLVNSNMTHMKADLAAANLRIEGLEAMIARLVRDRDARTVLPGAAVPPPLAP
jgi:hypothetical protein